jgi:nucleoside-diphosphate-sugar epimerase
MANILVTGGAGFIGSHLCEELLQRGHTVTCLDNFSTGTHKNIRHLTDLTVIEGDANTWKTFEKLSSKPYDILFHYAATVGVRRTEENPHEVLRDVHGLWNVARFARSGRARKVVFSSSSEVYGNSANIPLREEEGMSGWSPYATVKLYGEYVFRELWRQEHIPTVSLRFFNAYGPRQAGNDYGFVVGRFVQQALLGQRPTIFGDGKQTRDFVHISDNIRLALILADNRRAYGETVNIGTGYETSIHELARLILRVCKKGTKLHPMFLPGRDIEIERRCASIQKMQSLAASACCTAQARGAHSYRSLQDISTKTPVGLHSGC